MINKIKAATEKYGMLPVGATVVAAVSGGSDSMAMLTALDMLRKEHSFELCAAHVNHCLRGEDADRDEAFVVRKCNEMGIPVHVLRVNVAEKAAESGESFEECGRRVRYEFFASLAENAVIATAHNLDDRVETFLFNFARGSALRGLCSIPAKRDNIIRPLIECTKAEIIAFCRENSIEYVTDATNADVKYARNRIRHNVITELREINPSFENCAARCISAVNEDERFLSSLADEIVENARADGGFNASVISEVPSPLKKRAVIKICEMCANVTPEQKFVEKICDLLKNAGSLQINGGVTVRVRRGMIDFPSEEETPEPIEIKNGCAEFAGAYIETQIININEINNLQNILKQGLEYFLDCDKILGDVTVRSRAAGDKITLKARGVTKSLKKLFNELAVAPEKRSGVAVFADNGGVVLVEGVGCDARVAVTKATEKVMIVKIKR